MGGPGITEADLLVINKTDLRLCRRRRSRRDGARRAADARRRPLHLCPGDEGCRRRRDRRARGSCLAARDRREALICRARCPALQRRRHARVAPRCTRIAISTTGAPVVASSPGAALPFSSDTRCWCAVEQSVDQQVDQARTAETSVFAARRREPRDRQQKLRTARRRREPDRHASRHRAAIEGPARGAPRKYAGSASNAGSPECRAAASPRLVAMKPVYRRSHRASASARLACSRREVRRGCWRKASTSRRETQPRPDRSAAGSDGRRSRCLRPPARRSHARARPRRRRRRRPWPPRAARRGCAGRPRARGAPQPAAVWRPSWPSLAASRRSFLE